MRTRVVTPTPVQQNAHAERDSPKFNLFPWEFVPIWAACIAFVRPGFDASTGREGEDLIAQVYWALFTVVVAATGLWLARKAARRFTAPLPHWILATVLYPLIATVNIFLRSLSEDFSQYSVGLSWYLAGGVMCLAAAIAAIAMKHPLTLLRVEANELAKAAESLEAERSRFESEIARETQSIESLTLKRLSPTFEGLLDRLQRPGDMRANSITILKIRESIDKVLRPFVTRLTEEPKPTELGPIDPSPLKPARSNVPFQFVVQPLAAAAVVGMFLLAIGFRDQLWLDPVTSLQLFVFVLIAIGAVYAAHRVFRPLVQVFSRGNVVVSAVLTSTVYSFAGISLVSLVNLIPEGFLNYDSWGIRFQPVQGSLTVILCCVSIGIAAAAVQNVNRVVESQKTVEADRRLHNAKLRTQLWYLRRQTALFVHGEVQSALTSSAMELEKSATDEGARARIIQRLQKGLADLRERQERPLVLEEALADIQGTWAGVAQVSWSLHDIGASQIDAQPAVSASVAEIVRESVSNAIRHGAATEIGVDVRLLSGSELRVEITDNGGGLASSDSRGLGSSMLDETCSWWERTRVNEATTLRAIVAF